MRSPAAEQRGLPRPVAAHHADPYGLVTDKIFLGSFTRVRMLLSGDVAVEVDKTSTAAADLVPGISVQVGLVAGEPVLVAEHQ